MIYIQLVDCFLILRQVSGIENTQLVGYKSYQITNHGRYIESLITKHGRFFLSHIYHPIPVLLTLFFEGRGVGIHNVISKKYHMSDITLISRKICDNLYLSHNSTFHVFITRFHHKNLTFYKKKVNPGQKIPTRKK
jgi:hypothetical protein